MGTQNKDLGELSKKFADRSETKKSLKNLDKEVGSYADIIVEEFGPIFLPIP